MRLGALTMIVVLLTVGCVTETAREHEFTREWAGHVRHEDEFAARKARIERHGDVLIGKADGKGLRVESDDSGKPAIKIGGKSGLKVDAKVGGNSGATVRYVVRW